MSCGRVHNAKHTTDHGDAVEIEIQADFGVLDELVVCRSHEPTLDAVLTTDALQGVVDAGVRVIWAVLDQ
jgi:hypothetical protein